MTARKRPDIQIEIITECTYLGLSAGETMTAHHEEAEGHYVVTNGQHQGLEIPWELVWEVCDGCNP